MAETNIQKPKDSLNKKVSSDIIINGNNLDVNYKVFSVKTFKEINKFSRAQIKIYGGNSSKNSFEESDDDVFNPGNEIIIKLGYDQKNSIVFKGIIDKHRILMRNGYQKKQSNSLLIIDCVDKAISLSNSYTSEIFENKTDSEIIKKLLKKNDGIKIDVFPTNYKNIFFPKYNTDDWSFIIERCKKNGLVVVNSNNSVSITNPNLINKKSNLLISNSGSTVSFEANLNSQNQINNLKLNSIDSFFNKINSKNSAEPNVIVSSNNNLKIEKKDKSIITEIDLPSDIENNELKILADSILKISRLKKINGRTKFKGVPNIDLDSVVTLDGFGKKFDGEVYVTGVNHELEDGKVLTEISFGFNSNFLNTEKVLDKNNLVNSISGLHLGKVTDIDNDPLKQNRIKIQIPIISDKNKGIWAKLSHLFTSKNGGSFLIPEIGSQVVVSFIANDPRNPIILGSLYNHQFNPKYSIKKNNNIKSFTTKSNMVMEFDETENKITLSSPKGNKIVINEKSKEIKIIDENKNSICTSPNGIDIESKKNVSIVSGGNIELSASNKIILNSKSDTIINGSNILNKAKIKFSANSSSTSEIKSSGVTTLKGSIIQIN